MYCNNNFNRKQWAIVGPKLSGPAAGTDYRGATVQGTTINNPEFCNANNFC